MKKNATFTIDVDTLQKAKEEYDNLSAKVNNLLDEDLQIEADNKEKEVRRLESEIEESKEEIESLEESLEKEKNRKERMEKKLERVEKKIEKREAEKESKKRFFNSQLDKFERKKSSRDYSGLSESEKRDKFLDEYGNGIYKKFGNKVDADVSRAEFEKEFKEFLSSEVD